MVLTAELDVLALLRELFCHKFWTGIFVENSCYYVVQRAEE